MSPARTRLLVAAALLALGAAMLVAGTIATWSPAPAEQADDLQALVSRSPGERGAVYALSKAVQAVEAGYAIECAKCDGPISRALGADEIAAAGEAAQQAALDTLWVGPATEPLMPTPSPLLIELLPVAGAPYSTALEGTRGYSRGGFGGGGGSFGGGGFVFVPRPDQPVTPPSVLPSVPEPGTWLLMIAGFGMVGAAMRRNSRRMKCA